MEPDLEATERLKGTKEDEQRLFDAIAHDLNNQLAAIAGYAEAIGSTLSPTHQSSADVAQIHRAVHKASVLVGLCHGIGHVVPRTVELVEIVQLFSKLVRKLRSGRGDVVFENVAPGAVRADAGAVLEVLLLLDRVSSPRGDRAPRLVSIERGDGRGLRVVFPGPLDDGVSVPARADELVSAMRGELTREVDGWSLLLPVPAPRHRSADPPRFSRVLLVEPDGLLRSFLVSALDAEQVEEATDGAAAAETLRLWAAELDLVILPIGLEGLEVLEAYQRLRDVNPRARFVAIGRDGALSGEVRRLVAADPHALFMEKPFTVVHLVRAIDEMAHEALDTEGEGSS